MHRQLLRGVALAIGWAAFAAPAAEGAPCTRAPLAQWDLAFERGVPVTRGTVNGQAVGILVDTGSAASLLTRDAARRLGLVTRSSAERMRGIGGDSMLRAARIDELRIGSWSARAVAVHVGLEPAIPGVDLVLGEDVLHAFDEEFDYPARTVRLFDAGACGGASLGAGPSAQVLPFEGDDRAIRVGIEVNGIPALAMLDSGAVRTLVSLEFAYRAGLSPDAPGVVPAGCAAGLGGDAVRAWAGRFDAVRIAQETVRDAQLAFADFTVSSDAPLLRAPALSYSRRSPDVLLGNDFLRTHRVLVARGEGKLYFSFAGGTVFPPWPSEPGRLSGCIPINPSKEEQQ